MSIRVLASADIHIGTTSSGVPDATYTGTVRNSWGRLVEWACTHEVDVMCLCGDIVDRDNSWFEAVGALQAGFETLRRSGITVYAVAGNHDFDVLPRIVNAHMCKDVHLLGSNGTWETVRFRKGGQQLQVTGWSFPHTNVRYNPLVDFPADGLQRDIPSLGLLHCDVDEKESAYAPVALSDLVRSGVDAWLLGHIHKPRVLHEARPMVRYTGSLHALDPTEKGKHGPVLLEYDDAGRPDITHLQYSPVRYECISADISEARDSGELRQMITSQVYRAAQTLVEHRQLGGVDWLVYDIALEGAHRDVSRLDEWIAPAVREYRHQLRTGTRVGIRRVHNNARPWVDDLEKLAADPTPAGKCAETILAIRRGESTPFLEALLKRWSAKIEKVNAVQTWQDVSLSQRVHGESIDDARKYIEHECNRLLGELIAQRSG